MIEDAALQQIANEIITDYQKRGAISMDALCDRLEKVQMTVEQMETMCATLEEAEIHVVDEASQEQALYDQLVSDISIDDPVKMYLKDIGRIPLLSGDEEIKLAKKMAAGDQAKRTLADAEKDGTVLSAEEKAELTKMGNVGDDARRTLAEANLRLVVSIAKRHVGRGMNFLDLIQEGNMGLMKAVEKFDYERGYKLSTYATWWIRQAITRAIADQARTIRIPVHMVETIHKQARETRRLMQELGRDPYPSEIAAAMEVSEARVIEIQKISQDPVSLETPIGEEEDSHLGDFIVDENAQAPSDMVETSMLKEQLIGVLDTLTPREEKVIRLRYGIDDGRPRTLEEVGKEFNVTRERIRQIEAKALRKLRHPSRSRRLKDFID